MYWQALEAKEKVLRREYLSTLASADNFRLVLSRQGKYKEAKAMYWRALEAEEKVLRREHLNTLTGADNLGLILLS